MHIISFLPAHSVPLYTYTHCTVAAVVMYSRITPYPTRHTLSMWTTPLAAHSTTGWMLCQLHLLEFKYTCFFPGSFEHTPSCTCTCSYYMYTSWKYNVLGAVRYSIYMYVVMTISFVRLLTCHAINCKTINVSTPLMLAMQLLSLNFVDARQCGIAHTQSKTSTRGQKMAFIVLV